MQQVWYMQALPTQLMISKPPVGSSRDLTHAHDGAEPSTSGASGSTVIQKKGIKLRGLPLYLDMQV
jgi:hypothetical protein